MVRRQAFDKYHRKIQYAFYEDDYVVEYPDDGQENQIAFWNYDQYPYTLSGVVVEKLAGSDGVKVKGYDGFTIKAKAILPESEALSVLAELTLLKKNRQTAIAVVEQTYREKLANLSQRYEIPMPDHVFKKDK